MLTFYYPLFTHCEFNASAFKVYRQNFMLQRMTGQELANLIKEEEEDFIINNSELNVTCCIMMLDMLLKQCELQKPTRHLGLNQPLAKDLMNLINKHLVLPWIKRHKCKQSFSLNSAEMTSPVLNNNTSSTYCAFCEEYVLWFTFAKDILAYSKSNFFKLFFVRIIGLVIESKKNYKSITITQVLGQNKFTISK